MANQDWPTGMQPTQGPFDSSPVTKRFPLRQATSSVNQATAIYDGQIVVFNTTVGYVQGNAATAVAAAVVGVAAEYYNPSAQDVANQTGIAVYPPSHEFAIQCDSATAAHVRSDYELKVFPVSSPSSGNSTNGKSKMELDFTGGEYSTVGGPIQVVGFKMPVGSTVVSTHVICVVKFAPGVALGNQQLF